MAVDLVSWRPHSLHSLHCSCVLKLKCVETMHKPCNVFADMVWLSEL